MQIGLKNFTRLFRFSLSNNFSFSKISLIQGNILKNFSNEPKKQNGNNLDKNISEEANDMMNKAKEKVKSTADKVSDKVSDTVNKASDSMSGFKTSENPGQTLSQKAKDIASKVSESVVSGAQTITDKAKDVAEKVSETITGGKKAESPGMSHHQTMTDSYLNYMATGMSEQLRSRNQTINELVLMDHMDLRVFMQKFEDSQNYEEACKWLRQFIWEISRHSVAEELILYPMLKHNIPNGREYWNHSLEEHRKLKELLSHVENIKDLNELKTKVKEVKEVLIHHLEAEENEILPHITKNNSEDDRIKAGNKFLRRKLIVPTRPHTMAPDSIPTLESLVGLMLAPIDKFKDILFAEFPDQIEVDKIKKENSEDVLKNDKKQ